MRIEGPGGTPSLVMQLPEIARPSGIAVADDSVIYARLRRDEADLVTLRLQRRQ